MEESPPFSRRKIGLAFKKSLTMAGLEDDKKRRKKKKEKKKSK